MILHLLWDEKITNRIIKTFESVFPDDNYYLFWEYDFPTNLHFAYESKISQIVRNDFKPNFEISKVKKVIIHGLDIKKIDFCRHYISKGIPIFWILWGVELYNGLLYKRGYKLYYPDTFKSRLKRLVGTIFRWFDISHPKEKSILNFLNSNDVTMVCAYEEYSLLRKYYPFNTRQLKNEERFFYYPIDEIIGNQLNKQEVSGNTVIIGNSASKTNNHAYVFKKLRKLNLEDKKILTPLSYSGTQTYKEKIMGMGKEYFGESYVPLTEFLPLAEYNSLMCSSEICIFGSWRQEALGNIIVALYLGSKVFLSERNPLFDILRNWGLILFSLEKITQKDFDTPLSNENKNKNRQLLSNSNSWEKLKQVTYEIFK